jgi:hypothetical protein
MRGSHGTAREFQDASIALVLVAASEPIDTASAPSGTVRSGSILPGEELRGDTASLESADGFRDRPPQNRHHLGKLTLAHAIGRHQDQGISDGTGQEPAPARR